MKPIVVVGSINMDLVSRVEYLPSPGETVLGKTFEFHSGGKGANQAAAVAKLCHPVILLGALGNDPFAEKLRATLSGYGVDVSYIASVEGPSGTATIVVDAKSENTIVVTPGANHAVTMNYLQQHREVIRNASIVLAQLEIPLESVEWLASYCSEIDVPFMLDPAPATELPNSLLQHVTWFTPNESEAEFFSNGNAAEAGMQYLFSLGVQNILYKRGSQGATIARANGVSSSITPFSVQAVDTTAAGDAFNGAFAVGLSLGQDAEQSAKFAAAAAAVSVTRHGAQPSLATNEEARALLDHSTASVGSQI